MLCSFKGEARRQATIRDGMLIKIQWSDGASMTTDQSRPPMIQLMQTHSVDAGKRKIAFKGLMES